MKKHEASSNDYGQDSSAGEVYDLKLYVTGATPNSARAIDNVTNICEKHLPQKYALEIVDVYQQPSQAEAQQLIALPMLIKFTPLPLRRLIGNMSDTDKVLKALSINT